MIAGAGFFILAHVLYQVIPNYMPKIKIDENLVISHQSKKVNFMLIGMMMLIFINWSAYILTNTLTPQNLSSSKEQWYKYKIKS
jgi:hypothetical protein